jgi:hypothetical protein
VGGVPRAPGFLLPGRRVCPGWSADREGLQAGDRGGEIPGPRPSPGQSQSQPQAAAAAGKASRGGEEPQAQPFRFSAAGLPGESEHLGPGQESAGEGDDLAPELVLGEAIEGAGPLQPSVLGAADPVLAAGAPAVPQFEIGELAFLRVDGEGGEEVPVDAGEPQLGAGMWGAPCGR